MGTIHIQVGKLLRRLGLSSTETKKVQAASKMARFKFSVEAGLGAQGMARKFFHGLKDKILWEEPEAKVVIDEYKSGFLLRTFTFKAENMSDKVALAANRAYESMRSSTEE